jgi:rhamnogalacturonan endolyase
LESGGVTSNNGKKSAPYLTSDLSGDFGNKAIWRSAENPELRIYSTSISDRNRMPIFTPDPQ